ncbi:MAG: Two-component system sensor histidine kinase [uncultured Propionibacteriaceae bacterium]|uniref:histidine kinase n=1 Tax=uncultured Propionibacteriaceae bacterium TaxID=257457 RepID=A0A6J4PPG9_9ACTN|nr:MAG: Two-component system sensor histidine kinase [uncultured Propionibacteriaceae bacterium]
MTPSGAVAGWSSPTGWLARLSLRVRLMVIGVTGVAVALAAGGIGLYAVLTVTVNRTLDNEALASAREVATMVDQGRLPSPVPVSGAQLIQVVDSRGRVVGGSISADRLTPLLRPGELAQALSGSAVVVSGARAGLSGPLRVKAVSAGPANQRVSVIVAVQFGEVLTSRAALRNGLLISIPLLVLALALIAWRVIGWTLRPVEELRMEAERISGRDRAERLGVPRAADEIRALAVTLNGMLDRLAAARGRQQSFVADAAHELRSPLTSIRTQLEVADRLGDGGSLPADLTADIERLSALVEDLLLLARADAESRGATNPTIFDAKEMLAELQAGCRNARVPVTVEPGPAVPVRADEGELRRAVGNLVDNSVRHARTGVWLSAQAMDGSVLLSVGDDGPGIAEADRERVFDRFTRLDNARDRDSGGTGLGLAIVRELVSRAGGTVGFDAVPDSDGGACHLVAQIRLPAPPA